MVGGWAYRTCGVLASPTRQYAQRLRCCQWSASAKQSNGTGNRRSRTGGHRRGGGQEDRRRTEEADRTRGDRTHTHTHTQCASRERVENRNPFKNKQTQHTQSTHIYTHAHTWSVPIHRRISWTENGDKTIIRDKPWGVRLLDQYHHWHH